MRLLVLLASLAISTPALAGSSLPIVFGHWSSGRCDARSAAEARTFASAATATPNDRCDTAITRKDGSSYHVHLSCRFGTNVDQDDVVIQVSTPTALTWINQCLSVTYHYCGP